MEAFDPWTLGPRVTMADVSAFSTAFGQALDDREVGLTWLRSALADRGHRISLGALSYWRSGQREPRRRTSLEALEVVEELLGLPAGDLSGALRRRDRDSPVRFDELVGRDRALDEGRALVGEDQVDRLALDLVVDVGPDRRVTKVRHTMVVVAAVEGADHVTLFVAPGVGAEVGSDATTLSQDTILRAVAGCSVGSVVEVTDTISAARLRFDRPLALGESVVTEVELVPVLDEAALDAAWGAVAEQRLEHSMVWIRFHPDALPERCWVGLHEDGLAHEWPVPLAGATGLVHRQTDFGPGVLTARWEW